MGYVRGGGRERRPRDIMGRRGRERESERVKSMLFLVDAIVVSCCESDGK
jgi:hypothetical protein